MFPSLLARFKIMADLNIAERRIPQDGKIGMEINNQAYDFRVSTIPTLHGEKIVIRIYNRLFRSGNISQLGFSEKQTGLIMEMITRTVSYTHLTLPTIYSV